MDVVYLKGLGFSNEDTCKITGVCDNTMREYLKQYEEGGIDRLQAVNFYKPSSDLQACSGTIKTYLTAHPPTSISQAAAIIEKLTGIKRGETQIRKFFKSMRFRYIKSCSVSSKALTDEKNEQRDFLKKELEPRLAEAKEGKRTVYFVDAAHFVLGSFLGYLWCIARIFIPSSSGRKRYNVLGAIDAIRHELITV